MKTYQVYCITMKLIQANDNDEWFDIGWAKVKRTSCINREVGETIVKYNNKIDWNSTFYFMKYDIYNEIDKIFGK
jgi:hypothetical protein